MVHSTAATRVTAGTIQMGVQVDRKTPWICVQGGIQGSVNAPNGVFGGVLYETPMPQEVYRMCMRKPGWPFELLYVTPGYKIRRPREEVWSLFKESTDAYVKFYKA